MRPKDRSIGASQEGDDAMSESSPGNGAAKCHIGIVGVSPEGAALFYRQLMRTVLSMRGPETALRVSLHAEPLAAYLDAIRRDQWEQVGTLLRRSADLLHRCGVDFCLTPDHAVQHGVQLAAVGSPVPWVTPTDLVADAVAADGRKTVGILGTKLVMHSSTYQTPLGMRGVALLAPDESDAEALEQIIFGELLSGQIRAESRYLVSRTIESLAARGCEAIILALSEGSMLVSQDSGMGDGVGHSALPVYDASALLAEACVRRALPA